jgi:hypothetical protein
MESKDDYGVSQDCGGGARSKPGDIFRGSALLEILHDQRHTPLEVDTRCKLSRTQSACEEATKCLGIGDVAGMQFSWLYVPLVAATLGRPRYWLSHTKRLKHRINNEASKLFQAACASDPGLRQLFEGSGGSFNGLPSCPQHQRASQPTLFFSEQKKTGPDNKELEGDSPDTRDTRDLWTRLVDRVGEVVAVWQSESSNNVFVWKNRDYLEWTQQECIFTPQLLSEPDFVVLCRWATHRHLWYDGAFSTSVTRDPRACRRLDAAKGVISAAKSKKRKWRNGGDSFDQPHGIKRGHP